ncbi:MAG: Arginine N-succinyltransferase [Chlamydiales bacterium]|nr:Arginine N-succinyltransferase [Chlamydiales bacterium]
MPKPVAIVRPAHIEDLKHFYAFALEAGPGITSLPRSEKHLEQLLLNSEEQGTYLFCLEWDGNVIGTTGLVTRVGMENPFFAYHKRFESFHSASLDVDRNVPVLHFIEAHKKPTEIGTLYLKKAFRKHGFGPLLSYARFLYIALFRDRFASTVIAEMRGFNNKGVSPFWNAIGRPFFSLPFSEADHLRILNPEAIQELFPRHPIYTILLSQEAQQVISQPHPFTVPAKKMLEKQGFRMSDYLDIFDGGPHLYAPTDEIHAVATSQKVQISALRHSLTEGKKAIIATTTNPFCACAASLLIEGGRAILPTEVGKALKVDVGNTIIFYRLHA